MHGLVHNRVRFSAGRVEVVVLLRLSASPESENFSGKWPGKQNRIACQVLQSKSDREAGAKLAEAKFFWRDCESETGPQVYN
jgi:hypothetical protein